MKISTRRMFFAALVMALILAAVALPAAAHGFGPVFYCDAGTLNNCTDTVDVASGEDNFSRQGNGGGSASCNKPRNGGGSALCVVEGRVSGTERDSYLCGP